jgi:hypothetical protein
MRLQRGGLRADAMRAFRAVPVGPDVVPGVALGRWNTALPVTGAGIGLARIDARAKVLAEGTS